MLLFEKQKTELEIIKKQKEIEFEQMLKVKKMIPNWKEIMKLRKDHLIRSFYMHQAIHLGRPSGQSFPQCAPEGREGSSEVSRQWT